MQKAGDL